MGLDNRHYQRRDPDDAPGFVAAVKRFFSSRNGFFSWSLPLFTLPESFPLAGGIRVRVHIIYILIIISELLGSSQRTSAGFAFTVAMMATLFVLVLLHEFGHCIACRLVGGQADEILMWPLGGLAFCAPPRRWKPALMTTLAGPGVNAALFPVFVGALLVTGSDLGECFLNPFAPNFHFRSYAHAWLWSAHYMNLVLFLFNMLVPMFPMDCGRVVQELLWARMGYRRSMSLALSIGLAVAIAMGVGGLAFGRMRLVSLALFGGLTCYAERKRMEMTEDEPAWAYDTDRGFGGFQNDDTGRSPASERKALKREAERRAAENERQEKVDAILDKVRASGIHSLTSKEKKILKEATERKRAGE